MKVYYATAGKELRIYDTVKEFKKEVPVVDPTSCMAVGKSNLGAILTQNPKDYPVQEVAMQILKDYAFNNRFTLER